MQDNLVITLLHKQLTDQLDSTDKQLLLDWLANSSANAKEQQEVSQVWELSKNYAPSFTPNVDASFEKFSKRIKSDLVSTAPKAEATVIKMSPFKAWMKYAAAAVVLIGAVAVWQLTKPSGVEYLMASTIEDEVQVISLADGSTVGLNEKSTLNYPSKFKRGDRVVELSGQAFFDVASDAKKPFIIKGGEADVKVIGTSFSFDTDDDGIMRVEVKSGVVELIPAGSDEKVTLTKNDVGYYDVKNKKFLPKETLSVSNADYFMTDEYSFENSKYDYVFDILGNVYDVEFKYDSKELINCRLTSPIQFDKDNLQKTITVLEEVYKARNLKFEEIEKGTYLIKADPCK